MTAASDSEDRTPARLVVNQDAFAWLDAQPAEAGMSIVTSLPDVSELSHPLEAWRAWFIESVDRLIRWLPEDGVAIFYQSDIRVKGFWIDKGYLVLRGAENADAQVLWHKIVCRKPPGTIALGRASYSHMIAVTRARALEKPLSDPARSPDVLPSAGAMPWSRAMGVAACEVACRFLLEHAASHTVVDPFCGRGTVLAVANALGLNAIGIDTVASRCRAARAFVVSLDSEHSADHSPGGLLERGARAFDAGAFWDAHEIWESRWRVAADARERQLLQALIQIAAGFHKSVVAHEPLPAAHLFSRGLEKLAGVSGAAPSLQAFRDAVATQARAAESGKPGDRTEIPSLTEALRASELQL